MEKGKQVMGNEVSSEKAVKMNVLSLYPVEPYSSGEGFPYAPVDWPDPGDTWRWWVGKRTSSSGFYIDRVLYLPKRLHVHGGTAAFAGKSSFKRYISSQFPDVDIGALFASFSWMVPSTEHHWSKDLLPQVPPAEVASKRRKENPQSSNMTKKARPATSQAYPGRRTRQSYKPPAQAITRNDEAVIDLSSLMDDNTSDGSGYSKEISIEDVASDQSIGSSCYASKDFKAQVVRNVKEFRALKEDVDDCLKRLELILSRQNDEAQVRTPFTYVGSDMAEEMSTHRKKLSYILALDFSCMLSSECLEEIAFSVEKLAADPILTVDQLLKLKLVKEIPKAGNVFLQYKGIAEQATKFLGDLQVIKDKVSSIEREFSQSKKEEGELQCQIDSKSSLVREIDEQIVQLQSRKAELARDLELTNKAKVQVVAEQKIVANSISAVMQEIQIARAEYPIWEMKKKNAKKRMAEILARYAPLKGFSFEKSS